MIKYSIVAFFIFLTIIPPSFATQEWPKMREFELSVGLHLNVDRVDLDITFYDEKGAKQYKLICRGGNFDHYIEDVMNKTGIQYLPPLTCRLIPGMSESGPSLLNDDGTADYYSRGQLHAKDFDGKCAHYPEYGRIRHFRLRGFELTFEFSDIKLIDNPYYLKGNSTKKLIDYVIIKISLKQDSSATTAKAEQPGYLDPFGAGRSCNVVKKGYDRAMCRNPETFSWETCPNNWRYERYLWEKRTPAERKLIDEKLKDIIKGSVKEPRIDG